LALSVKKKLANLFMEIKIAPEIVIRSARHWQHNLLYKSFTHPNIFVTLATLLFEKTHFL